MLPKFVAERFMMRHAKFYINGIRKEIVCSEDRRLLDVLSNDLGLTGAKRGYDNEGHCGACSIIIDRMLTVTRRWI